ncbi:hypothetical protein [Rhizobium sp. SSA_523]|uniref:hypothetical protein n=1 Tax=Rhizobium sp. SSA_523 TaxID=2952477 RepID=UPI0020906345|nr:hypothetical protein [Rhizobium sp. SSA_523]MCO5730122.1 hypothetical protein [Rhizobium sp. SSA_523]WKC25187.1 hypothetical protein QTJ18_14460 [Rhizobium sp. SSA_523]
MAGAAIGLFIFTIFPMCRGDNCSVQGWLSALSGWAAAAAALVTLNVLRKQVESQNKQIKFLMGENPPVAEHWRYGPFGVIIRLVNWNQTKFIINAIEIQAPERLLVHSVAPLPFERTHEKSLLQLGMDVDDDGTLSSPITIPGWEGRGAEPAEIFLEMPCGPGDGRSMEGDRRIATVLFKGHLSGPTREEITVAVDVPIDELVFV